MVHEDDDLLISTSLGIMIRMAAGSMRVAGRATQGVKIIRLDENDSIADIAVVKNTGEETDEITIQEPMLPENDADLPIDDLDLGEEE